MDIEFDPVKSARNDIERGLPFSRAAEFEFATATIEEDDRKLYPEVRLVAVGFIGKRLHVLCFSLQSKGIRVISLRKANRREIKAYEQKKTATDQ